MRTLVLIACAAVVIAVDSGAAHGHEQRAVEGFRMTVGWAREPAYAGMENAVHVNLADGAGTPITDLGDTLQVEVVLGDQRYGPVALRPASGQPGEYQVPLVPTRPGAYTFRLSGTARGQAVDESFTASETTFDEVRPASDVEFPSGDPSRAELSTRLDRVSGRVDRAVAEVRDTAGLARNVAIGAAVAGLLGLALGAYAAFGKR